MGILYILICVIILGFIFSIYKDVACPPFLMGIVMAGIYGVVWLYEGTQELANPYYMCFLGAFLAFTAGFAFSCNRYAFSPQPMQGNIKMRKDVRAIAIAIADIAAVYQIVFYLPYLQSGVSIYRTMRVAQRDYGVSAGVSSTVLETFFYLMLVIYILRPTKYNLKGLLYSLPCTISLAFTSATKATWFYMLITCAFLFILIRRVKSRKVIVVGILGAVAIMVLFVWASYDYATYAGNATSLSVEKSIAQSIKIYFALPAMAFVRWADSGPTLYHGLYTFRFVCAVLNKIIPSIRVVDTIQPFYAIDGLSGNVYTALHWYASDFGIPWMLAVYMFEGLVYGLLYRRARSGTGGSVFSIVMLGMLVPPLCEQFFSETIFSVFSMWLQRAIILWILTRPKYVLVQDNTEIETHKKRKKIRLVWGQLK